MAVFKFSKKDSSDKPPVAYRDLYFRIVLCIVAAHILVMYNEPDSFFEAVFTLSYWVGMAASFLISLLLTSYIHYATLKLDRQLDWSAQPLTRLFWQALLGFALPAIGAFLLAAGFFALVGMNILKTTYLSQDYTIILLMLLVMNLYYFGLNSYLLRSTAIKAGHQPETPLSEKQPVAREVLIVDTPTRSIPVKLETACYFFILGKSVFMRTVEMASLGDSYRLDVPLKVLEGMLDRRMFFRINRQMIVNFKACEDYRAGNKTLRLTLKPVTYPKGAKVPKEHERLSIISEDRVQDFKIWMDR